MKNENNKNAAKDVKKESFLHVRCLQSDKALWVMAAQAAGEPLSEWTNRVLNEAAKNV